VKFRTTIKKGWVSMVVNGDTVAAGSRGMWKSFGDQVFLEGDGSRGNSGLPNRCWRCCSWQRRSKHHRLRSYSGVTNPRCAGQNGKELRVMHGAVK